MRAAILAALTAIMVLIGTTTHAASVPTADTPEAAPVMVPYMNKSIREVKNDIKRDREEAGRSESWADGCPEKAPGDTEETFSVCDGAPDAEEEDPGWEYYGECRITHYDDCEECCGIAGNTTASGVYPTSDHTVATGEDLPFGTEVMINGQVYVVEDRGVDPYQIDIFVPTHAEAVERGMYYADVYVRYQ